MPTETIKWNTKRTVPKAHRDNLLSFCTYLAKEVPSALDKPYHPVLFIAGTRVIAGRYFPKKIEGRRWWSLQGAGYYDKEVTHWAEIPKGPK